MRLGKCLTLFFLRSSVVRVLWLGSVGIPYLALTALAIIDGGWRRPKALNGFITRLGVDACILGIGISGALFATPEVRSKIGENAPTMAVTFVLIDLILTGFCTGFRDHESVQEVNRARICIFLGMLVLAVNTYIVLRFS